MEAVGAAAAIIGIAATGAQISLKFITFAEQVSTAAAHINAIASEVALVSATLQQLGELIGQKTSENDQSIFSESALRSTTSSAEKCKGIFEDLQSELRKASADIRKSNRLAGKQISLSRTERAKWPFLQPRMKSLRADLQEAKLTLIFMLQTTTLAYSIKLSKQ